MTPNISAAEVEKERQEQIRLAHGAVKMDYKEVQYSKSEKVQMQEHLQNVVDKLKPEATALCHEMNGDKGKCDLSVELVTSGEKSGSVNAYADGEKIVVFGAMVDFAKEEEHLAFILAHEYTHHMMGHVSSTRYNAMGGSILGGIVDVLAASQGINTQGAFMKTGGQMAVLSYSPDFEHEADYIALYMLARAGFEIEKAPEFWRMMGRYNREGIYNRTTHPTTPERFVMMGKTIAEIRAKEQNGQQLLPNLLPQES